MVAINNFSNFGVDRTVIYYRPEAERVATTLNKKFSPGAELESAPRLAESVDVKVVLGDDRGPQQPAEASKAHGLRLYGLSGPVTGGLASPINRFQTEIG